MLTWKELDELLKPSVAFKPIFARIGGGAKAGLFLSQAYFWTKNTHHEGGWFYKSQLDWDTETTLTDEEQLTARRQLIRRGLLEEERRGIPAQMWYRIDRDAMLAAINEYLNDPEAYKAKFAVENKGKKSRKLESGNTGIKEPAKPETGQRQARQQANGRTGNKAPATTATLIGTKNTTKKTLRGETSSHSAPQSNGKNTKRQTAALAAYEKLSAKDKALVDLTAKDKGMSLEDAMWQYKNHETAGEHRRL